MARALFDVARWAPDGRLSELLAGFPRENAPPVPYPAACHPQGWDAAIPLALAHLLPDPAAPAPAPLAPPPGETAPPGRETPADPEPVKRR